MQVSLALLLTAAGLLPATAAFKCRWGQYGECYYYQGENSKLSRCAIGCTITWKLTAKCRCPSHYPNKPSWDYTHQHQCINLAEFNSRSKCQDPNIQRRDDDDDDDGDDKDGGGLSTIEDGETPSAGRLDGRDLAGREGRAPSEFQRDHDLPLSYLDGLSSED